MRVDLGLAGWVVIGCWVAFGVVWFVAARFARQDKRQQSSRSRVVQSAIYVISTLLLIGPVWLPLGPLSLQAVPRGPLEGWIAMALAVVGIGFAIWSRLVLGANWSGRVTLKEGHELIKSGPYAIVRHPIYTGMLTAFIGTAVLRGTFAGFVALGLYAAVFVSKIRTEERFLGVEFGAAFADYRRRVRALIPFVV